MASALAAAAGALVQAITVVEWVDPLGFPPPSTERIDEGRHAAPAEGVHDADPNVRREVVARDGVTYQQCFDRSIVEIKKAIPVAKETGTRISVGGTTVEKVHAAAILTLPAPMMTSSPTVPPGRMIAPLPIQTLQPTSGRKRQ